MGSMSFHLLHFNLLPLLALMLELGSYIEKNLLKSCDADTIIKILQRIFPLVQFMEQGRKLTNSLQGELNS